MANGRQIRTSHFVLHQWQVNQENTGPGLAKAPALLVDKCVSHRLGVVVPKRWAKKAVTRNLIRRQVKELLQSAQAQLPAANYVVRLRQAFAPQQFISASSQPMKLAVRSLVEQLLQQLKA